MPTEPRSKAEECFQQRRLEISEAQATWSEQSGGPAVGYIVTTTWSHNGMVLFHGGERLTPGEAIKVTGDQPLAHAYDDAVSSTSGKATAYEVSRDLAFGLAGAGLALTCVALVQVINDNNSGNTDAGIPVTLWIGAGLAVLSVVPTIVAGATYKGAIQHSLDLQLMPSHLVERTLDAVHKYNDRVAAECGYEPAPAAPPPQPSSTAPDSTSAPAPAPSPP
jgi:hypothetical protein